MKPRLRELRKTGDRDVYSVFYLGVIMKFSINVIHTHNVAKEISFHIKRLMKTIEQEQA